VGLTGTVDARVADDVGALAEAVRDATAVVPVGSRTHWEVGGPPPTGTEVRAPAGVVEYDPAELTVTVGAGTRVTDLDAVLADRGQQCPLDPRDPEATVGGVLATGLSGVRRLRMGPVRNRLLEVHLVLGDGRCVKGGGRTVKNVSGYDVARLVVGSLGTLGVLVQVTLRCEPKPVAASWWTVDGSGADALRRAYRPSAVLVGSDATTVLLEGFPEDVAEESARVGGRIAAGPPAWPAGPYRARLSVRPAQVDTLVARLSDAGLEALGEAGVGTVHVAAPSAAALAEAVAVARDAGGWSQREAGDGPDPVEGLPSPALTRRIKDALDPAGKCNPGRLPFAAPDAP
jgi:glycolate oxidase FAD binding subunit